VKDEKGDLFVDSHILNRWKNYVSQLLSVRKVSAVRQTEIHTAELLVPTPSPFEIETATAKLKSYNSPGSNNILAEMIEVRGEILQSEIHKLNNSMWCKENLAE
jgi:hypothetical protein